MNAKRRIPVLLYHRIDQESESAQRPFCVAPEAFRWQMAWLRDNGYASVSLAALQAYYRGERVTLPERPVVITFDDGYYCNYSRAFPALQENGLTATIFLAIDLLRQSGDGREGRDGFMAWPEIAEMHAAGFAFESHGCSHQPLDTLSPAQVEAEMRESKAVIEAKLAKTVHYFCYPFGRYNEAIKAAARAAGYAGACGGPPFWQGGPDDWYEIGRTEILWGDSLAQFRFKVEHGLGYYYFLRRQLGKVKRLVGGG